MELLTLSAADLRRALPMPDAIEAMRTAFAALSAGVVIAPQRAVQPVPAAGATALLMSALIGGTGLCAKVATVFPGNTGTRHAVVNSLAVVFDEATGVPTALVDGTFLTAWRTGAASGLATAELARADVRSAAIIGCGAQARTQLAGIAAARSFEVVRLYSRNRQSAERFAEVVADQHAAGEFADGGPRLEVVDSAAEAVRGADVVCAATSSKTPVFDGGDLAAGVHVNAIGAFRPDMRELDGVTVARARVFVDQIAAALEEAGDLIAAEREGQTARSSWTELGDVVGGSKPGRRAADEITVFKSVGQAAQDVVAACLAVERAKALGLGKKISL